MIKKTSLIWYGLAIFLASSFNLTHALSNNNVGLFDVLLFLFGLLFLVVSYLISKEDV